MPQFSLYEYYNVKHQQRSVINILSKDTSSDNKLIAYINAFDFLVKRKPWNIEEKEVTIFPKEIDYQQSRLSISQEPMKQTNAEMSISNCNNLMATSIKTNLPFSFSGPDSLILYFTGSWCAPCRELTPQVEKYFENLPKGWKGMVIANEKSLSAAKAYLNKFSFQNTFFEHLDDKTACSLKKIFSVGVYPTLVYINPTGRVLWIGQNIRN
jgi:thiol-disulfide isomerase/thioredoxin